MAMPPRRRKKPASSELACLGEALRVKREEAGLTQEELAAEVGTGLAQVGETERGHRNPGYMTLRRMAAALGTTVGEISDLADQLFKVRSRRRQ